MKRELDLLRELRPDVEVDAAVLARERSRLMSEIRASAQPLPSPPPGTPQIIPHLPYDDLGAALVWLRRAFGFREVESARVLSPEGRVVHAEMQFGAGRIMLGSPGGHGALPPKHIGGLSQLLSVYVNDLDAHCERARSAGARIVAAPVDKFYGDRVYEALDLEGHRWSFHQPTGRTWEFRPEEE
jgi:uncharacterized glyoxalase superfamily protein PhnB